MGIRGKAPRNKSIRKELGLSQEDYLPYLMVNRSALAMYENNQRSLPFHASAKIAAIEICLSRPETENATEETLQQQKQAAVQLLHKRHEECQLLIMKTKQLLQNMQQKYQQCLNMIKAAATVPGILQEILPNNEHYAKDVEYLENHAALARYKMKDCSIGKQQLLQLKIDALQFEMNRIQQWLNE